jgi:alkylated DNA repair dioxygenase AlkB
MDRGQLTLFDSRETLLVDGERGRIVYVPAFIHADTARAWFTEIRAGVGWRAERRMMYEREVDVPRLVSHFRLDASTQSVPQAILDAAGRVTERVREPFNSVGLNLYRDGRDSVAPHNDHLDEIRTGFSIALVSLGATRRMSIRAKVASRRVIHPRSRAGQPVRHELRYAAALYACRAEDAESGWRADQPRIPRSVDYRTPARPAHRAMYAFRNVAKSAAAGGIGLPRRLI